MIKIDDLTIKVDNFSLESISFEVPHKSWGVLMGKSGSGKTTIIETICGLRKISSGKILLDGKDITHLPPSLRKIGYVPQDVALFPTMTVKENIAFPLETGKWNRKRISERIDEISGMMGIEKLMNRTPGDLSGGESQLVAIGRALSFEPSILCLDEPLSSLDGETREKIYLTLEKLKKDTAITTLLITHNPDEAGRLGDLVIELKSGACRY